MPASPSSGRWWIGLLTAALFAFHVNYVRIHLLTEVHHSAGATASPQALGDHHEHPAGDDHDHDHNQHQPHSAAEHHLQLAGKQQSPWVALALLLPEASVFLPLPQVQVGCAIIERGSLPGESPPDPRQPRAPPTV